MSCRILFATHAPSDPRAAMYRAVVQQVQHLREDGHHVDLIARDDLAVPARLAGLDPLILPWLLLRRGLASYDVVVFHSHLGWAFQWMKRWLDPRGAVATITWFHGLEPLHLRAVAQEHARSGTTLSWRCRLLHGTLVPRLLAMSCRRSDAVFCLNGAEVEYLQAQGWAARERVHRVSHGVDAACFQARSHPAVARRLLFVGPWLPANGTRDLVEAFTSLAALRDVELVCVGTGVPVDPVKAAFPVAVRPSVSVLPRVDRDELYAQLRAADLCLVPSLSEGFSGALVEAMAAGLPVVATHAGAAPDLIESGRSGVLVPCAKATAMAAAAFALLDDPATRAALGDAARRATLRHTTEAACRDFAMRTLAVLRGHHDVAARPAA